mgnify:CR=1 FL=1
MALNARLIANDLGDTGAKHLSEALKFNSTLARLNLGSTTYNASITFYLKLMMNY